MLSPTRRTLVALPVALALLATLTAATAGVGETGRGAPTANWVVTENAKAGTSAWRITPGASKGIAGYADKTSAKLGGTVTLYVDTGASSFRVEAYRLGYYSGLGGRLIWTSASKTGVDQSKPKVTAVTNMVEARWSPSITFTMGSGWVQGNYLFKLVSSTGG